MNLPPPRRPTYPFPPNPRPYTTIAASGGTFLYRAAYAPMTARMASGTTTPITINIVSSPAIVLPTYTFSTTRELPSTPVIWTRSPVFNCWLETAEMSVRPAASVMTSTWPRVPGSTGIVIAPEEPTRSFSWYSLVAWLRTETLTMTKYMIAVTTAAITPAKNGTPKVGNAWVIS